MLMCFPGDIQIGMMEKKGQLEVEVIRARGLVQKPGSKSLPGKDMTFIHERATGHSLPLKISKINSLNIIIPLTPYIHCNPVHTLKQSVLCALPSHEGITSCEI